MRRRAVVGARLDGLASNALGRTACSDVTDVGLPSHYKVNPNRFGCRYYPVGAASPATAGGWWCPTGRRLGVVVYLLSGGAAGTPPGRVRYSLKVAVYPGPLVSVTDAAGGAVQALPRQCLS